MNASASSTPKPAERSTILELLILAVALFAAHYVYFRSLGLYEDDYAYISQALGWHLGDLIQYLKVVMTLPQGRPLGYLLPHLAAFVGGRIGGLGMVYILGYLVQITNVFLFYFLLSRIGLRGTAWIGALVFGLFPADTTHIFLMHSLGLHTSLTFLLLAAHSYLSGHKAWAHWISLGSLLTYESPYLVFLAIPLLGPVWDRRLLKELWRHAAVWLGILLAVVGLRAVVGEGRIETLGSSPQGILVMLGHSLESLVIGPAVSLWMFLYGPGWMLLHWFAGLGFILAGSFAIFAWLLSRRGSESIEGEADRVLVLPLKLPGTSASRRLVLPLSRTAQLLLAALIMLSLAYGFSFTHFPPTTTYGRLTSVHLAAAFGGALLFAGVASLLLAGARSRLLRSGAIIVLALYLALLVAYRFSIQLDFRQAWQNERTFWSAAMAQVPDMQDGTLIFVVNRDLPVTRFILSNSWADPIMLPQIFQFPANWAAPPRLFVVPPDWTDSVVVSGSQLSWEVPAATWKPHWELLPSSNVILLEMENGQLVRRYGSILIRGQALQLKPLTVPAHRAWKNGLLYPLLLGGTQ
jgi:hypothetical protein